MQFILLYVLAGWVSSDILYNLIESLEEKLPEALRGQSFLIPLPPDGPIGSHVQGSSIKQTHARAHTHAHVRTQTHTHTHTHTVKVYGPTSIQYTYCQQQERKHTALWARRSMCLFSAVSLKYVLNVSCHILGGLDLHSMNSQGII